MSVISSGETNALQSRRPKGFDRDDEIANVVLERNRHGYTTFRKPSTIRRRDD